MGILETGKHRTMSTTNGLFITGTDTGVGKTRVSVALMEMLKAQDKRVAGMKPIASGARLTPAGLRNEDAEQLQQAASIALPYERINPYCFAPAIAPHLAARAAGRSIDLSRIVEAHDALTAQADWVIVEGVGGWKVPLGKHFTTVDLAAALGWSVLLVVGLRLGCLNHALLTADAIAASGVALAGWVANYVDPQCSEADELAEDLDHRLSVPRHSTLPWQGTLTARDWPVR